MGERRFTSSLELSLVGMGQYSQTPLEPRQNEPWVPDTFSHIPGILKCSYFSLFVPYFFLFAIIFPYLSLFYCWLLVIIFLCLCTFPWETQQLCCMIKPIPAVYYKFEGVEHRHQKIDRQMTERENNNPTKMKIHNFLKNTSIQKNIGTSLNHLGRHSQNQTNKIKNQVFSIQQPNGSDHWMRMPWMCPLMMLVQARAPLLKGQRSIRNFLLELRATCHRQNHYIFLGGAVRLTLPAMLSCHPQTVA